MAVWRGGGSVVGGGAKALVAGADTTMTFT
jgi:hypothetical protein